METAPGRCYRRCIAPGVKRQATAMSGFGKGTARVPIRERALRPCIAQHAGHACTDRRGRGRDRRAARGRARARGVSVARVATGGEALAAASPTSCCSTCACPTSTGTTVCRELRSRSDVPIIIAHRAGRGGRPRRRPGARRRRLPRQAVRLPRAARPDPRRDAPRPGRAAERRRAARMPASLEVDARTRRAHVDGRELALTPKEFDLLALLAARRRARSSRRRRILEEVWDTSWYGPTKTIDVHVAALRKKLGDPGWIETVRGIGLPPRPARVSRAPALLLELPRADALRARRARDPARHLN